MKTSHPIFLKQNYELFIDGLTVYNPLNRSFYQGSIDFQILRIASQLKSLGHSVYVLDVNAPDVDVSSIVSFITEKYITVVMCLVDKTNQERVELLLKRLNYLPVSFKVILSNKDIQFNEETHKFVSEILNIEDVYSSMTSNDIKLDYTLYNSENKKKLFVYPKVKIISNNSVYFDYRDFEQLFKEINTILSRGFKYFHVIDPYFLEDKDFVEKFCLRIRNLLREYPDFMWSCEAAEDIKSIDNGLVAILKGSHLAMVMSICKKKLPNETVLSFINKLDVPVFSITFPVNYNFVYKTYHESFQEKLKDLLTKTNCHVEMFFGKKSHDFGGNSSDIHNLRKLNYHINNLYNTFLSHRKLITIKRSLKNIENLYKLKQKYNIDIIIEDEIDTARKQIIEYKSRNEYVYFSWDIHEHMEDYSIKTVAPIYVEQTDFRRNEEYIIYNVLYYSYEGLTLGECVNKINEEGNTNVKITDITRCMSTLEELGYIYYVKYLR